MEQLRNMTLRIERGIPIPENVNEIGLCKTATRIASLKSMTTRFDKGINGAVKRLSKGYSFVIPKSVCRTNTINSVRDAGAIFDSRLAYIQVEEGIRVWRVCNDGSIPQPRAVKQTKVIEAAVEPEEVKSEAIEVARESSTVEMANHYSRKSAMNCLYEDGSLTDDSAARREAFIAGAEWMKAAVNQMLDYIV